MWCLLIHRTYMDFSRVKIQIIPKKKANNMNFVIGNITFIICPVWKI